MRPPNQSLYMRSLVDPAHRRDIGAIMPSSNTLHDLLGSLAERWAKAQVLALLRKRAGLKGVRIKSRLTSLRADFSRVIAVLARDVKK